MDAAFTDNERGMRMGRSRITAWAEKTKFAINAHVLHLLHASSIAPYYAYLYKLFGFKYPFVSYHNNKPGVGTTWVLEIFTFVHLEVFQYWPYNLYP